MLIAETIKSGAIKITDADGVIRTKTGSGNISILPARGDVVASSLRGNIEVVCEDLLPTNTISVGSQSGHISVSLPKEINAYIDAQTEKGKLTSDHAITFVTKTTKLNSQAWADFKRTAEGYIGEDAEERTSVQLRSVKSNIKILTV